MEPARHSMAVVGTFDGVHLGHRHLIGELVSRATAAGLSPMVVTFRQHPLSLIRPSAAPSLLTSPAEKEALLREAGAACVVTLDFDENLRRLSARDFMAMLRDRYGVAGLLLGFNHRFGHDSVPGVTDYAAIGRSLGLTVSRAGELRGPGDSVISSSTIRQLIAAADMQGASAALGRCYSLTGIVEHGRRIGHTIGFPTANVGSLPPGKIIPPPGVYEAVAFLADNSHRRAVVNIGRRPTVDDSPCPAVTIEAHIPGFDGDLYGAEITLRFVRLIRLERRFPSLDALRDQIALDIASIAD